MRTPAKTALPEHTLEPGLPYCPNSPELGWHCTGCGLNIYAGESLLYDAVRALFPCFGEHHGLIHLGIEFDHGDCVDYLNAQPWQPIHTLDQFLAAHRVVSWSYYVDPPGG